MKLILRTYSSDENFNGGADFALLDLTPERARIYLGLLETFNHLRDEKLNALDRLTLWGSHVDYFSPYATAYTEESFEALPTADHQELAEKLEDQVNEAYDDVKQAPNDFVVHAQFTARTEGERLIVEEDEIRFFCRPKYCDAEITTMALTLKQIKSSLNPTEKE